MCTPVIHVGGGPSPRYLSRVNRNIIKFHDFESLDHKTNSITRSPDFSSHGYDWNVRLYPGGNQQDTSDSTAEGPVYVALYLHPAFSLNCTHPVRTIFSFKCPGSEGRTGTKLFSIRGNGNGWIRWMKRDSVISDHLKGGTLTIEVDIQVYRTKPWTLDGWTPKPQTIQTMAPFRLATHEVRGSFNVITFDIGQEQMVKVHRFILSLQAPVLYSLVDEDDNQEVIRIENITNPKHFQSMIDFLYYEDTLIITNIKEDLKELRELLMVANRFGGFKLKILLEDAITETHLDSKSAIELLLFADANNCSILREASMATILADVPFARKQEAWNELKKSALLLDEILAAQVDDAEEEDLGDYADKTFGCLYSELEAAGKLDRDGTRAMLVARLKEPKSPNKKRKSCCG